MSDITTLAKRIILIGKGKVLYDGSLKKLKDKYETETYISVKTKDTLNFKKKGIISKRKNKDGYELVINNKLISISELLTFLSHKISIEDIEIEQEPIDKMIVRLYEDYQI